MMEALEARAQEYEGLAHHRLTHWLRHGQARRKRRAYVAFAFSRSHVRYMSWLFITREYPVMDGVCT